jgi:hypothetical protein
MLLEEKIFVEKNLFFHQVIIPLSYVNKELVTIPLRGDFFVSTAKKHQKRGVDSPQTPLIRP